MSNPDIQYDLALSHALTMGLTHSEAREFADYAAERDDQLVALLWREWKVRLV